ncbi:ParB N-terminal domain-containing protein [Candidatus Binatus sp.]|jgi:ParB-like chromosome segregation protein Spo0J|uniref:ParB N-terminal domain-containing protein n=1 Tax=Candidatus Binatus sp. TaxID=2811406 RepID=UPI003C629A7F
MRERRNHKSGQAQRHGTISYRLISELRYPDDARPYSGELLIRIACRIETYGIKLPILVDTNLMVIAGRGRILACEILQWTAVPTICLQNVGDAEARALVIGDNRLCELYEWDDEFLPGQLRELRVLDEKFAVRYERLFDRQYRA